MRNKSGIVGTLDFEVEADSSQQASELAESEYQDRARRILDVLSFVVEDGLVLGNHYDPIRADAELQQRMDSNTSIDGLILGIGDGILESAESVLEENPRTQRALSWYNLGLSTETPEDEFIAFWTGLEAAVESQSGLTDWEEELYEDVVDSVEDVLSDEPEFRHRLKSILGEVQREDTVTSLTRSLVSETDHEEDDLSYFRELNNARADVVHYGKQITDASEKAHKARHLLLDLLDSRLSTTYEDLLEGEAELPEDRERAYHTIESEEWLQIIFNGEEGRTLSTQEIQQQAYALLQDIHEVARLKVILLKFSGWGEPLHQTGEGGFRYSPSPDWVTPEIDAILQYLHGAGWVTPEVIGFNLPEVRNDVEALDVADVEMRCEELLERNFVEESENYFKISHAGEMCLDGRLDPREVTTNTE